MKKAVYYYTLEDMQGNVHMGATTKRLAKKLLAGGELTLNEGICYKRKVGDAGYKKFAFMW